jgi:hypothetical protein
MFLEREQFGACGRILINVVEGTDLTTHPLSGKMLAGPSAASDNFYSPCWLVIHAHNITLY